MKFSVAEDLGEVVKVSITGCLTQADIAPPHDPFPQLLGADAFKRKAVLDMRDSNYLDSMCIGWLLNNHKKFRENGGKLVLHSLQPLAMNVITLLHLNNVFNVYLTIWKKQFYSRKGKGPKCQPTVYLQPTH